jgi:hypothetical protein
MDTESGRAGREARRREVVRGAVGGALASGIALGLAAPGAAPAGAQAGAQQRGRERVRHRPRHGASGEVCGWVVSPSVRTGSEQSLKRFQESVNVAELTSRTQEAVTRHTSF